MVLKIKTSFLYFIKKLFNLSVSKLLIFLSFFLFSCSSYSMQAEEIKPEAASCNISRSISEKKDFVVDSTNLKHVRTFCREVFEKLNINQDLKDELILAIAEAAQNIVKHAYKNEKTERIIANIGDGSNYLNTTMWDILHDGFVEYVRLDKRAK